MEWMGWNTAVWFDTKSFRWVFRVEKGAGAIWHQVDVMPEVLDDENSRFAIMTELFRRMDQDDPPVPETIAAAEQRRRDAVMAKLRVEAARILPAVEAAMAAGQPPRETER